MSKYEYNALQMLFPGTKKDWRPQPCDVPDRRLDRAEVPTALSFDHDPLPETLWDELIRLPESPVPWKGKPGLSGRPIMRASDLFTTFYTMSAYGEPGEYRVPLPHTKGGYWVEDTPHPWSFQAFSDFYDKHIIMIHDDGRSWEMIGATHVLGLRPIGQHYRAQAIARFDKYGNLHPGDRPVIAAKRELSPMLWNRQDEPHRLTITVRGSDKGPQTFPYLGDWLALNPKSAPVGLPTEAQRLVDMLVTHGVIIGDHGGITNLSHVSGSQWAGVDLTRLNLTLSDFGLVESA